MTVKIVYIGKDKLFYNSLQNTIASIHAPKERKDDDKDKNTAKKSKDINYQIESYDDGDFEKINPLMMKLVGHLPNIIYLDFSFKTDKICYLCWRIRTTPDLYNTVVIGVLNTVNPSVAGGPQLIPKPSSNRSTSSNHAVPLAINALSQFVHYKVEDLTDMIFDGLYTVTSNKKGRGTYATYKKVNKVVNGFYCAKLTHIEKEFLIIESSFQLGSGEKVTLSSDLYDILDNKEYIIEKKSDKFTRTAKAYRYKVNLIFQAKDNDLDNKEDNRADNKGDNRAGIEAENDSKVSNNIDQNQFNQWFAQISQNASDLKHIRLLVIQKDLEFLTQLADELLTYPYTIRYQTKLAGDIATIEKFRPNLIAINYENEKPLKDDAKSNSAKDGDKQEASLLDFNGTSSIKLLIDTIKKIDGYKPIIAIFNANPNSAEFQKMIEYGSIISYQEPIKFHLLVEMLKKYSEIKKNEGKYRGDDLIPESCLPALVPALDLSSLIYFNLDLFIVGLNEHEVTFVCNKELPIGCIIKVGMKISFFATVVKPFAELPSVDGMPGKQYLGLIHGLSETKTGQIRQYINSLFFQEHDQKKQEEIATFKKKNVEYLEIQEKELQEKEEQKKEKEKKKEEKNKAIGQEQAAKEKAAQEKQTDKAKEEKK